jgi:hypothetical protein
MGSIRDYHWTAALVASLLLDGDDGGAIDLGLPQPH